MTTCMLALVFAWLEGFGLAPPPLLLDLMAPQGTCVAELQEDALEEEGDQPQAAWSVQPEEEDEEEEEPPAEQAPPGVFDVTRPVAIYNGF